MRRELLDVSQTVARAPRVLYAPAVGWKGKLQARNGNGLQPSDQSVLLAYHRTDTYFALQKM